MKYNRDEWEREIARELCQLRIEVGKDKYVYKRQTPKEMLARIAFLEQANWEDFLKHLNYERVRPRNK